MPRAGFSIGFETTRSVYLAGETFDVHVKTRDAADRPSSEKLLLKVFRQDHVGETTREELVAEHPLATAADGTAQQTLKLAKGGEYNLRATGTDRFGNTIAGALNLTVSGDDDPRRLLLLVDRTRLKAGDAAEAQIVWRGQPALAVVTCHGDRLIQQRQIALQTGLNHLQIPVTAAMAPGFTLTVSVMADGLPSPSGRGAGGEGFRAQQAVYSRSSGPRSPHPSPLPQGEGTYRLHEAACALRVDPDLQVKIECHRHGDASAPPRPGEAADVTVTTCDAQGKPVAAEVSLAILPTDRGTDGALSGISLPSFFRTRGRTAQFQAASSIQFHYRPAIHALATAEPEEDVAAVPAHLAAQQGVPMPKPDARKPARHRLPPRIPLAALQPHRRRLHQSHRSHPTIPLAARNPHSK